MADGTAHAPDLPVASFVDDEAENTGGENGNE